ncbi:unnamed protein product [Amaranthus hypochondriacus]
MDWKKLVSIVVWLFILIVFKVRGAKLSRKENLELEKQLKLLNKPSIKTIKTKYGDTYDCVDFYKQPAFDHPLLKNHNFHPEMRPSVVPKWRTNDDTFSTQIREAKSLKLKHGGCPKGTVPIRRVTKDYLIQIRQMSKRFGSRHKSNGFEQQGIYYSVVQSKSNTVRYKGVGGALSVYNVTVGSTQYSASEFTLLNGPDVIQFGLMTRRSHCYHLLCPGFVSLRQDIPIDAIVEPVSKIGGPTYEFKMFAFQDPINGNWWLEVEKLGIVIGFWPRAIFSGLKGSAYYIAVGGEAYSLHYKPLPLMGNGHYPYCTNTNISLSAFCQGFVVVNTNSDIVNPEDTEIFSTSEDYATFDLGVTPWWGRVICFGGPERFRQIESV